MLNFNLYTGIQIMIFIQLSFNIILYNTILGAPVSSTIINWPTRYNWNSVESGVKQNHIQILTFGQQKNVRYKKQ